MKNFLDKEFLLENDTACALYHDYAENMPIIDFHNHLFPQDIYEKRQYEDLTELWLETDHYKWRAMRAQGIDEK
ncbi:MAG: glucuronate isomerase, partial [Oscillospiraceae bacterium]